MTQLQLMRMFSERPEFLVGLVFSAPTPTTNGSFPSLTIDFMENHVVASVRRQIEGHHQIRILATKDTVLSAILLHHLISERGPEFASSLIERMQGFADSLVFGPLF